jgi:probable rRNA maturation factor
LSFVTPAKIQSLNKRYRGKDRPTDVLSFSVREGALPEEVQKTSTAWGDVIICPSYAKTEAKRRSLPLQEELARLVIHGVLHLAGYDHATEDDELRMFSLQERIIERLLSYA